ncbi:hypothetical protein HZA97_09835 [Candidatus Woesearchaeota archaeon]|nr:hypothetical protein [Candidatus Woesearchaeota archaeon]
MKTFFSKKKIIFLIFVILLLILVGCKKEDSELQKLKELQKQKETPTTKQIAEKPNPIKVNEKLVVVDGEGRQLEVKVE